MAIMQRFDGGIAAKRLDCAGAAISHQLAAGITAHAGGGQASATLLSNLLNSVDTVGTAADSVKLPPPMVAGQMIVVINNTAASMQVFGSGTDTINGVATATGVAQAAGKMALYIAMSIGAGSNWFRLLSA